MAIGKQLASVVEHDDPIAQQAPALTGLVCHDPRCPMIKGRPLRTRRLMVTHGSSGVDQLVGFLRSAESPF
jgi:hypothetical protein